MKFVEPFLATLPIWMVMNLFGFSKEFGARMVYPLTALFLRIGHLPFWTILVLARGDVSCRPRVVS